MFLQRPGYIRIFLEMILLKVCGSKKKGPNGDVYLSKKSQALLLKAVMSTSFL